MPKHTISVILPAYNSQEYIADTIESILNQTYPNFELIIVNDGSTDNTEQICHHYQLITSKIKYYSIPNQGVSNARNLALTHATGHYVTFIDSDDTYQANYLEELIISLEKNNSDLVCCAYQTLSDQPKIFNSQTNLINYNIKSFIETLQPQLLFNQIWNKIYKLEIIRKNNLSFDITIDLAEDYLFNLDYLSSTKKLTYINIPLYNYRIKSNGLGFKYRRNSSQIKLKLLNQLETIYQEQNYNLTYIIKSYIIQYCAYFSNIVDKRNSASFREKLQEIKTLITSRQYSIKLKELKKQTTIKFKIIITLLLIKNKYLIYLIGLLANHYDQYQKKKYYC